MDLSKITQSEAIGKDVARKIAYLCIDEKGAFLENPAKELIELLSSSTSHASEHVKNILSLFIHETRAKRALKRIALPLSSPFVEKMIRKTLDLKEEKTIDERDVSLSILFSLLVFLRQTVGSCFATAPLIYVQANDPLFLLEDLTHLLIRGFLKRVIRGEEYKVPISIKGALETDSPLMKCYEYTVASFADWKVDFYKWNMYASLGLDSQEPMGIGEIIYETIQTLFEESKKELDLLKDEMEARETEIQILEGAIQTNTSLEAKEGFKREIQAKEMLLSRLIAIYNDAAKGVETLSKLHQPLSQQIVLLFPFYFQEVYDPDMKGAEKALLEDTPSGFRLLFKGGRQDPSQWSMVYKEEEFLESLTSFFEMIEPSLYSLFPGEVGRAALEKIVSSILSRIREPSFLKYAYIRMKEMHLEHAPGSYVDTPWSYISGGNMESLVRCYFKLDKKLKREEFFPKEPLDLLTSLIEFMKDLPALELSKCLKSSMHSFLMTNPSHAFLFQPGHPIFQRAWQNSLNTYTYVRDKLIAPFETYYKTKKLSEEDRKNLSFHCKKELPDLPLRYLFEQVKEKELFEEVLLSTLFAKDLPRPIVFADTNWRDYHFAFILSPRTFLLELWLISQSTLVRLPDQRNLFHGGRWTVFKDTSEYTHPDLYEDDKKTIFKI